MNIAVVCDPLGKQADGACNSILRFAELTVKLVRTITALGDTRAPAWSQRMVV